ncbi:MAG TPA: hypothetical protein VN721_01395 [Flavipsychrobacter sp.]|nr:hypothetical protein [Flavipsychrobacter sp.]
MATGRLEITYSFTICNNDKITTIYEKNQTPIFNDNSNGAIAVPGGANHHLKIIIDTLFTLPGAFFRWMVTGFKKPFVEVYGEGDQTDIVIGALFMFVVMVVIIVISNLTVHK